MMAFQIVKRRHKGKTYTAHQGWKEIDGKRVFFRSDWEYQYALSLQEHKRLNLIKDWEHEPQTFWFNEIRRGTRSYLPDFKVTNPDGSHYWVEVKGYMDAKSRTKIRRFGKYYPNEKLIVIGKEWFNGKKSNEL